MLHPSEFFKWCIIRTGIDTFEIFNDSLKQKLVNLHPKNFIKTRITHPIYEITISYETGYGNLKTSKKYMVADSLDEDEFSDVWIDIFIKDYETDHKEAIKSIKILDVKHIADAVLQIG